MNVSYFVTKPHGPVMQPPLVSPLARRGGTGLQGGPALHRQGGAGGQEGQPFRLPAQVHGGQDLGELHRCRHSGSVRLPGKGRFF